MNHHVQQAFLHHLKTMCFSILFFPKEEKTVLFHSLQREMIKQKKLDDEALTLRIFNQDCVVLGMNWPFKFSPHPPNGSVVVRGSQTD